MNFPAVTAPPASPAGTGSRPAGSPRSGRSITLALPALLALAAIGSGCATTGLFGAKSKAVPQADARNPASEILAIWKPAEGAGLNGVPTRGFAGQILFFTRSHATPVEVHGDVRIYVFDDRGTLEEQSKPIHQFDFPADAWKTHLQMSPLGPSYQLFIPYTRKDHHQATCSLRVRLKPAEGPMIYSETANVTLPGPRPPEEIAREPDAEADEQAALEEDDGARPFDVAAAKKLIAAELGKNGSKSSRGPRPSSEALLNAPPRSRGPNDVIATLSYTADARRGRSVVRAHAVEDDAWYDEPAGRESNATDRGDANDDRAAARIKLAPATSRHEWADPADEAFENFSTEEEDFELEDAPRQSARHKHPLLADEDEAASPF